MGKGKRLRGGIASNLDVEMSPAQRRQAERDAFNDGVIQDAVERAKKSGPGIDILTDSRQHYTTTYDRLAEKSARVGNRGAIIPIAVQVGPQYPGGFHWILSDGDMDLIDHGMACPFCLGFFSEVWEPACRTCGMDRDLL